MMPGVAAAERGGRTKDDDDVAAAIGLSLAWHNRGSELAEAMGTVRQLAGAFTRPADERAEPMPSFVVSVPAKPRR